MRERLAALEGKRAVFRATFKRLGAKPSYRGPAIVTLLFVNVRGTAGELVTDHLWFTMCKQWQALDLQSGDEVEFSARGRRYMKGYRGRRDDDDLPSVSEDFKLAWPRDAKDQPC